MFSHPIAEGCDSQFFGMISHVNDTEIQDKPQLIETIRKAKVIATKMAGSYETMVFDRQEMLDSTEQIPEDEGIRYPMSESLRKIWVSNP